MIIDTTININDALLSKIDQASTVMGKSTQYIVLYLLKKIQADHGRYLNCSRRVEYQKALEGGKWLHFHIVINIRDYEYLLDMRKICKKSVSFLLAIAVFQYLDDIINDYLANNEMFNTDNYQFKQYILIKKIYGHAICWEIYWDLPEQTEILFH